MTVPENILITEILKHGWVTLDQLEECREIQKKVKEMGLTESLVDILIKRNYVTKEQVATLVDPEKAGKVTIPGYRVIARIGTGGMGVVYKAIQLSVDRTVAIKVLPLKFGQEKEQGERFIREARNLAQLNHVNIVSAIDAGQIGRVMYYVMEFVDGESVGQMIRKQGKLPEAQALNIAVQTSRALDHAQKHKLVHRDIKPDNILITKDGTAKLADLGLAKSTTEDVNLTQTGIAIGTPNYISPEQARGERILDVRSDIYSLGAALYHMVVGEAPFKGTTALEVITKHLTEQLSSPKEQNPQLSDGICIIIEKMMAKDKEDRYQDAASLIRDLELVIVGKSPTAERPAVGRSAVMHKVRVGETGRGTARTEAGRKTGSVSRTTPTLRNRVATARGVPPPQTSPKKKWLIPATIAAAVLVAAGIFVLIPRTKDNEGKKVAGGNTTGNKANPVNEPRPRPPVPDPSGPTPAEVYQTFMRDHFRPLQKLIDDKQYRAASAKWDELNAKTAFSKNKDVKRELQLEWERLEALARKDADELIAQTRTMLEYAGSADTPERLAELQGDLVSQKSVLAAAEKAQLLPQAVRVKGWMAKIDEELQTHKTLFAAYDMLRNDVFSVNSEVTRHMRAWNYLAAARVLKENVRPRMAGSSIQSPILTMLDNIVRDYEEIHKALFLKLFENHSLLQKAPEFRPEGILVTIKGKTTVMNHDSDVTPFWVLYHVKYGQDAERLKNQALITFLVYDGSPLLAGTLINNYFGEQHQAADWYSAVTANTPFAMLKEGGHKADHLTMVLVMSAGTPKDPPKEGESFWTRYNNARRQKLAADGVSHARIEEALFKVYEKNKDKPPDESKLDAQLQEIVKTMSASSEPKPKEARDPFAEYRGKFLFYSRDAALQDWLKGPLDRWVKAGHKLEKKRHGLALMRKGDRDSRIVFGDPSWKNYTFGFNAHWWAPGDELQMGLYHDADGSGGVRVGFTKEIQKREVKEGGGKRQKDVVVLKVRMIHPTPKPVAVIELGEVDKERTISIGISVYGSAFKVVYPGEDGKPREYEDKRLIREDQKGLVSFSVPGGEGLTLHEMLLLLHR